MALPVIVDCCCNEQSVMRSEDRIAFLDLYQSCGFSLLSCCFSSQICSKVLRAVARKEVSQLNLCLIVHLLVAITRFRLHRKHRRWLGADRWRRWWNWRWTHLALISDMARLRWLLQSKQNHRLPDHRIQSDRYLRSQRLRMPRSRWSCGRLMLRNSHHRIW